MLCRVGLGRPCSKLANTLERREGEMASGVELVTKEAQMRRGRLLQVSASPMGGGVVDKHHEKSYSDENVFAKRRLH